MSACFAAPVRGAAALFAAAILVVAGCNRPVGTVAGKVTFEGKALKGGGVTFVSADGGPSFSGTITPDGTYKVPSIVGGAYKVTVDNSSLKGGQQQRTPGGTVAQAGGPVVPKGMKTAPPPGAAIPEGYSPSDPNAMKDVGSGKNYVAIPAKYASADTTDLTYTFKGGDDKFDIDLK